MRQDIVMHSIRVQRPESETTAQPVRHSLGHHLGTGAAVTRARTERAAAAVTMLAAMIALAGCSAVAPATPKPTPQTIAQFVNSVQDRWNANDCKGFQALFEAGAAEKLGVGTCEKFADLHAQAPHQEISVINQNPATGDGKEVLVRELTTYADGSVHDDTGHFFVKQVQGRWVIYDAQ